YEIDPDIVRIARDPRLFTFVSECAPHVPVAMRGSRWQMPPVGDNDRLVGMVTDRDVTVRAVASGKDVSELAAKDVMTKGIVWCRDADDVTHAANIMQSKQVRRLPVIDKNKRMVGILSLGDLSHSATERTAAAVTKAVSAHHADD